MNNKQFIEDHKEAFGEGANVQTYGCQRIMDLAVVWVTRTGKLRTGMARYFCHFFDCEILCSDDFESETSQNLRCFKGSFGDSALF